MSACIALSISESDPRLTTEVQTADKWCPVDLSGSIIAISALYSFLKEHTQELILALWDKEHSETARRLANCGLRGSVYKVCKKGKRARAHRHTCHCWICDFCGQAKNLLYSWLRTRAYEVRRGPQRGMMLTGPLNSRYRLGTVAYLLSQWFYKKKGIDSMRRLEVEARPTVQRYRMVFHTDQLPYAEALKYLRRVTHDEPGWSIQIHHDSSPLSLLRWMFESTASVLQCCPAARARLYDKYYHSRLLKTCGAFYLPAKDPRAIEAEEPGADEEPPERSLCNCGECDGVMVTIPWNERVVDSTKNIEAQYEHVDWSSSYNPLLVKRNQGLTYSTVPQRVKDAWQAAITPSPPS